MARVVHTYAAPDEAIADRLRRWMITRGHDVVALRGLRISSEGLKDRAVAEINRSEYVIALLTDNSWATVGFAYELGPVSALEVALQRNVLVAVVVGEAPVPSVLGSRPTVRLPTGAFGEAIEVLGRVLLEPVVDVTPQRSFALRKRRP